MSATTLWLSEVSATSVTSRARHALLNQLDRLSPYRAHRWTEGQLCADFELGRAAVRTALVELRTWQLVRPIPRQGYAIDPLTRAHWTDISAVWKLTLSRCDREQMTPVDDVDDVDELISSYAAALRACGSPTAELGLMTLPVTRRYLRLLPGALIQEIGQNWNTLASTSLPTSADTVASYCDRVREAVSHTLGEQESAW